MFNWLPNFVWITKLKKKNTPEFKVPPHFKWWEQQKSESLKKKNGRKKNWEELSFFAKNDES